MSDWNIAAKPQELRDKNNVDLAAPGVAYKECERNSLSLCMEATGCMMPVAVSKVPVDSTQV